MPSFARNALAAGVVSLLFASPALAAIKYYSGASSTTWYQAAAPNNWGTVSGGPYNTAQWAAYDDAVFEGTGATVTVSGTVHFNSMNFTSNGYTITGGTVVVGNPIAPSITVASGSTATVNSAWATSGAGNTIQKLGAGTFVYGGSTSSMQRALHVNGGEMQISSTGNFTTSGQIVVGQSTATGNLTVNGGTLATTGNAVVGSGTAGILTVNSGTFSSSGQIFIGLGATAKATVNGGSFTTASNNAYGISIGGSNTTAGFAGTLELNNGAISLTNSAGGFVMGEKATATYTQTGGTFSMGGTVFLGNGAGAQTSNFSISAGSFTTPGSFNLAIRSITNVTLSDSGTLETGSTIFGNTGGVASTGTINLNGGTLFTNSVSRSNGTANFNFNGGVLKARQNNAVLMTGLSTVTIQSNGAFIDSNTFDVTISQVLGGASGALTKQGAGMLVLSGANTYGGGTTVSVGKLRIGAGGTSGSIAGNVSIASGATLEYYRSELSVPTIANAFSGNGDVSFLGTGASNQSGYVISSNNSAFAGTYSITAARVILDSLNDFGSNSVTINNVGQVFMSAALTYTNNFTITGNGWSESAGVLGALRFAGGANVSGTITLAGNSRITAYGGGDTGTISGAIGDGINNYNLEKTGAGSITLTNVNNTYSGQTNVNAGTLLLTNASSNNNISQSSKITIASGAMLNVTGLAGTADLILASGQTIGGTGRIVGNLTVGSGATIAAGASPGTLLQTGNQTWLNGGTLEFEIDNAAGTVGADPGWDLVNITGSLDLSSITTGGFTIDVLSLTHPGHTSGPLSVDMFEDFLWEFVRTSTGITGFQASDFVVDASGFSSTYGGSFTVVQQGNSLYLDFTAVPEPSSMMLCLVGLGALAFKSRKRRVAT